MSRDRVRFRVRSTDGRYECEARAEWVSTESGAEAPVAGLRRHDGYEVSDAQPAQGAHGEDERTMTTTKAIADVATERCRQARKWGSEELDHLLSRATRPSTYGLPEAEDAASRKIAAFDGGEGDWVWILTAEVARFARAAINRNRAEARRFAVRVGAVAIAVVESIDKHTRSCAYHDDCDEADAAQRRVDHMTIARHQGTPADR